LSAVVRDDHPLQVQSTAPGEREGLPDEALDYLLARRSVKVDRPDADRSSLGEREGLGENPPRSD
jgi:hypothetical protein